ncbi:hypothetical protein BDQ17DRAFT_1355039 [Cyathus striatus]|nr:hypothetical protein BDQ17DRAFT_1355039 [Cyathus striatus]
MARTKKEDARGGQNTASSISSCYKLRIHYSIREYSAKQHPMVMNETLTTQESRGPWLARCPTNPDTQQ